MPLDNQTYISALPHEGVDWPYDTKPKPDCGFVS
jgi:hypothetical protein